MISDTHNDYFRKKIGHQQGSVITHEKDIPMASFFITKSSGEKEPFNLNKLSRSLHKAGASNMVIDDIMSQIKSMHPHSSQEIHQFALNKLAQHNRPIAARYDLKQAIMKFGPAGYPFEQYVARILQADGYQASINQIVNGLCITHEIDVIATKENKNYLVECKFHNNSGLKTDVKVPLYIQARFEDVIASEKKNPSRLQFDQPWIWSNTQFTTDAIEYAQCADMRLTGWAYPEGQSLPELIDRYGLYPITALTCINQLKKNILIEHGVILCRDIPENQANLARMGFNMHDAAAIIAEAQGIMELKPRRD